MNLAPVDPPTNFLKIAPSTNFLPVSGYAKEDFPSPGIGVTIYGFPVTDFQLLAFIYF